MDTTSPTVALESILITSEIDAHERRDVTVVNITGELLITEMVEYVIMILRGTLD